MNIKDLYLDAKILWKNKVRAPKPWNADGEPEPSGCGCLTIYTDDEIDRIAKIGAKQMAMLDGASEYNVIVDVVSIHENGAGLRSQDWANTSVKAIHDAYRNRGQFHQPDGVDTGINFSMGEYLAIDITQDEQWATAWASGGVVLNSNAGMPASEIFRYARQKLGNYGADNRIVLVSYNKATPSSIAGFAYLGQHPSGRLSGAAVRWNSNHSTHIHEVGHMLGLFHTFHGTSSCEPHTNCEIQGDRVCDTPQHMQSNHCGHTDMTQLPHASWMSYYSLRRLYSPGQVQRSLNTAANIWSAMIDNPRVYWPDETPEEPQPPVEPPEEELVVVKDRTLLQELNLFGS
jgi:hypothetical protein